MDNSNQIEKILQDCGYRLDGFLTRGRNYDLAVGRADNSGRSVIVKSIHPIDSSDLEERIEALQRERKILRAFENDSRLPALIDWIEVSLPSANAAEETPLLVYEYLEGETLEEQIEQNGPFEPSESKKIIEAICRLTETLHRHNYVLRDFSPAHFIWSTDAETLSICGIGNIISLSNKPLKARMKYEEAPYVAPEIRREYSGKTLLPQADVYGVGALFSFVLTGHQVKAVVENPLSADAYEQLKSHQASTINRIIAKSLQPLAKHRFENVREIRTQLAAESDQSKELSDYELPEPWEGVGPENDPNEPIGSELSAGPLVGRKKDASEAEPELEDSSAVVRILTWGILAALAFATGWLIWP